MMRKNTSNAAWCTYKCATWAQGGLISKPIYSSRQRPASARKSRNTYAQCGIFLAGLN